MIGIAVPASVGVVYTWSRAYYTRAKEDLGG